MMGTGVLVPVEWLRKGLSEEVLCELRPTEAKKLALLAFGKCQAEGRGLWCPDCVQSQRAASFH
jgi:hypothetical protein